MGKRINIELNDTIYEQIKVWAKREKRPVMRQIEWVVEQAIAREEIHPQGDTYLCHQ
jgi:hypothetical protein